MDAVHSATRAIIHAAAHLLQRAVTPATTTVKDVVAFEILPRRSQISAITCKDPQHLLSGRQKASYKLFF